MNAELDQASHYLDEAANRIFRKADRRGLHLHS